MLEHCADQKRTGSIVAQNRISLRPLKVIASANRLCCTGVSRIAANGQTGCLPWTLARSRDCPATKCECRARPLPHILCFAPFARPGAAPMRGSDPLSEPKRHARKRVSARPLLPPVTCRDALRSRETGCWERSEEMEMRGEANLASRERARGEGKTAWLGETIHDGGSVERSRPLSPGCPCLV